MIKVKNASTGRVRQGDVLRDVEFIESIKETRGTLTISKIVFPWAIVLTQDCDLEQECKIRRRCAPTQDKWLLSVLMAPLYNFQHVLQGEHLRELDLQMEIIGNKAKPPGKYLMHNERPRYHYIEFPGTVQIVPSVIDFKHYFSVASESLKRLRRRSYVCTVSELYREQISARFAGFLSRIGLPNPRLHNESSEAAVGSPSTK